MTRLHPAHVRRRSARVQRERVPIAEVRALGLRPNEDRARDFPPMGEDDTFLPLVRSEITRRGLCGYHTGVSIGSDEGFPDLAIWGSGGLVVRELKGTRGTIYRHQLDVVLSMRAAGIDAGFWWPEDHYLGVVCKVLDRLAQPAQWPPAAVPVPAGPAMAGRRAKCGCLIDENYRIPAHTCEVWGPPS